MRRKDTQILDNKVIDSIIKTAKCCRLGLCDEGLAYIVPMSFGFSYEESTRIFYFHSAYVGRKIELIKKAIEEEKCIAFEIDTEPSIEGDDKLACSYTAHFFSLMGLGKISFIEDKQEKVRALETIMQQNTGKDEWEFLDSSIKNVCVLKFEIVEITAKEKK